MNPRPSPLIPRPVLAAGSAVLLLLAFPNFNQPWCAWIALVPWLHALRGLSAGRAFWWSWGIGAVFFLGSLWWLIHVTLLGLVLLSAILAGYFGLFGWAVVLMSGSRRPAPAWARVTVMIPSLWVALEYARSHLFSGLGWNLLAYSQTSWTILIQFADLTGVWGVSFLIVMVNAAIADILAQGRRASSFTRLAVACGVFAAALGYGVYRLPQVSGPDTVRVAVVQGNIPQEQKWEPAYREPILARYEALTRQAATTQPQLVVWPETSTPGFVGLDEPLTRRLIALARSAQIPLLVGAPRSALEGTAWRMTNSAVLVHPRGILQWYDKLHLVPFGEFVPFEAQVPWLRGMLPPIGEFVHGYEPTVFAPPTGSTVPRFSVLICFEDLFPQLARRFVLEGAELLFVITNDAWFGPTAAAYQHTQASTFRAVELRRPLARAANTGWSGCIEPSGRWAGSVQDASGTELFIAGTRTCDLPLSTTESLYLRWGDWFALLTLLVSLGGLLKSLNSFSIR